MYGLFGQVVEILFTLACFKTNATRHRLAQSRLDLVLEEHIHEHVHRLRLDYQGARRFERISEPMPGGVGFEAREGEQDFNHLPE